MLTKFINLEENERPKAGVLYNILSPDEITVRYEDFETEEEALAFYQEWKDAFKRQGYYAFGPRGGRIELEDLDDWCAPIRFIYAKYTVYDQISQKELLFTNDINEANSKAHNCQAVVIENETGRILT